ncbi:MAG: FtsX-like permease family protein [Hyphomicrobiaceae bacterium]|nr:FtsX-like permease family protein [Hyphomicrobiaceae bacterium]MCC0025319.1 FtsX-like permease family protein [Hyphomicrobiaceae bacterium]
MSRLWGWIRVGLADLRGDMRRFGLLIICLALGTSVIAAVGSVGTVLKDAVERDATALMGGDLEATRPDRDATPEELAFFRTLGTVSQVVNTNAHGSHGEDTALIDLVAADGNYPLLGNVLSPQLESGQKPTQLLAEQNGAFGAIVDPVLLDNLGIELGQEFTVGEVPLQVRGELISLPDSAVRGFHLGLTVLISTDALAQMADLRSPLPGLLTKHSYKIVLNGIDYDSAAKAIADKFGPTTWEVQSPREAVGPTIRYYNLFTRYLLIIGLSSLLVGGVGVSSAVSTYVGERQRTIAILRTLGATSARVLVHHLAQIGVLIGVGVGIGVFLGAVASLFMLPLVGGALSVNLPPTIVPAPLLVAAGFGILSGFAYAYLPLMQTQRVSPALLFRSPGMALPVADWWALTNPKIIIPVALAALGVFALAVYETGDVLLVAWYAIGVAATFALLRGAAWLLQLALRSMPPAPMTGVRNVVRSIYGPGSSAPVVIVSIGLGLSMVLIIALLESNLHSQLLGSVMKNAPTFVATDLFDDEVAAVEQMQKDNPDITEFMWRPMLRGAVIEVNGVDTSTLKDVDEEAQFLFSGEIPMTWTADLPANSTVVEGEWWPEDYSGPPLISLRSTMKAALNLKVGDTFKIRMFGEEFDAKIANFREYQYQNGLNFMVTFSPGDVQYYPSTNLGTIKAAEGKEKDIERLLNRNFPTVAFIPVGDALKQAATILGQLGTAVNVVGGIAVINGLLVLAGTMAAGRKQRESDAVIKKVLGATRGDILRNFVAEYAVLGVFSSLIATFVGIFGAWIITESALEVDFNADPVLIFLVIVGAVFLTLAAGAITTWQALSTSPARFLRTIG